MKRTGRLMALALALLVLLTACGGETSAETPVEAGAAEFEPRLDTEKAVELNAAVFFGNFEALDQIIDHFNEFYPNVKIFYEQQSTNESDFLANNPSVDILMTSDAKGYPAEDCADLTAAGVDVSAIADALLAASTVDGKLRNIPMGLSLRGLAVNRTLLEKEGLEIPQTWPEFLDVLEQLKQKGYTPIQGPSNVMGELGYDMGMAMMSRDPALLEAVAAGDAAGAAALGTVYERIFTLFDRGYFSEEKNADYPEDNYDGAILRFFEGDVPFWVCNTEKFSGMKKRESKSEAFSAEPFDYAFTFVPLGDTGVCEYIEPWYGFAVNRDSASYDYAVEFLRFMAQKDELNTLASVKGVPSIAKEAPDERYTALREIEKVDISAVHDGSVPLYFGTLLCNTANDALAEGVTDADEAVALFVSRCVEAAQ